MNRLPFSPLTLDSLVGAAIHAAAFGGRDGFVLAHEIADAIAVRDGRFAADGAALFASDISVGVRS